MASYNRAPQELKNEVIANVRNGASVADEAQRVGYQHATVYQWVWAAGIKVADRTGRKINYKPRFSPALKLEFVKRVLAGESSGTVGTELGISDKTAYKWSAKAKRGEIDLNELAKKVGQVSPMLPKTPVTIDQSTRMLLDAFVGNIKTLLKAKIIQQFQ
jgi:transposase-like protein